MTLNPSFFHDADSMTSLTMGNLLQRISLSWPPQEKEHRFLIFGRNNLLCITPLTISLRITALKAMLSTWTFSFPGKLWQSISLSGFHSAALYVRRIFAPSLYETYKSTAEEDRYWKEAAEGQRELQRSDARYVGTKVRKPNTPVPQMPPTVMYYTPALLPEYRDSRRRKKAIKAYSISAKDYCKWHWMVFPGLYHPSIAEANKLRHLHPPDELQMIHCISRMLPDDKVFGNAGPNPRAWTPEYQKIWLDWFNSPDRALGTS
ncbi:hypothetical protein BDZ97DRAFT_1783119 [Flammula alnicola]|nr:hypothetical protein BDZ97DRAFT_1783119 [Flammula alnicola]